MCILSTLLFMHKFLICKEPLICTYKQSICLHCTVFGRTDLEDKLHLLWNFKSKLLPSKFSSYSWLRSYMKYFLV